VKKSLPSDGPAASILVVDDEEWSREMLLHLLRGAQFAALQAGDGPSSLALIEAGTPDLVLLDNRMPGMTGTEVLMHIRARFDVLELPVIMLTSEDDPSEVAKALELGANDYIIKPANLTVALARIRTQLIARRAEMRYRRAAKELQRSNRDLEQFALVASHDLQEPLRKVTGALALLVRRNLGVNEPESRELVELAVDGARRMQQLIRDLLEYSRLRTRRDPAEMADLGESLRVALADLGPAIAETRAAIVHDAMPVINGDGRQLTRVFANLIGNAIKFQKNTTPEVHIAVVKGTRDWEFSVSDNGIGIDPERAGRLFSVFERLHSRSEYPGNGLGLAICRQIVEAHGGQIWVDSAPRKGSTFRFTIPLAPQLPDEPWFVA